MSELSRKFVISILFSIAFIIAFFMEKFTAKEFILGALGLSGTYSIANLIEHFMAKK